MKNTYNPYCPTQESDFHVPLSASLPVRGANAGLGFVVRRQAVQWVWMGVLARGVSPFHCQVRGLREQSAALLLLMSPSLVGGVVSSRAFFFFASAWGWLSSVFEWLRLGVLTLRSLLWAAGRGWPQQIVVWQSGPFGHLSLCSTVPSAPGVAPAASAVVLDVSFWLWVFLMLFW